MPDPTLGEIAAEIEVLEAAESFGAEVQQFTDWLSTLSGGDVQTWLAADSLEGGRPAEVDKTIEYELGKLKDAAFEFSETLSGFADNFKPLTDAAGTADELNQVVQTVSSLSTMIGRADEAVGAQKATELANVISSIKDVSTLLSGLSLNPVIGVFIGLYATALQNATIGLEKIEAYAARRNEIIASRGGEIDYEAIEAQQAAEAESAEAARSALSQRLNELYERRAEAIGRIQETDYLAATNDCVRTRQAELTALIKIAAREGGIVGNAPSNGETLRSLEGWVEGINEAAGELFLEASVTPEGPARDAIIDRLDRMTEARRRVVSGLRPFRDCVRQRLEQYGTSTADVATPVAAASSGGGRNRRMLTMGGGAGIFTVAAVGLVLLLSGGGDDPVSNGSGSGSSDGGSAASDSAPSGRGGSAIGEAPVIVHPCDVFTVAEVSGFLGATLVADRSAPSERRAICTFRAPDAGGGLHVEVQRNSAADGFFDEFRFQRMDQTAVPVDWPNEAEIRQGEGSSSFWGYVITDDPLGRDVFVWIAGASEGNSPVVLEMANRLRAAILLANGRPPHG